MTLATEGQSGIARLEFPKSCCQHSVHLLSGRPGQRCGVAMTCGQGARAKVVRNTSCAVTWCCRPAATVGVTAKAWQALWTLLLAIPGERPCLTFNQKRIQVR